MRIGDDTLINASIDLSEAWESDPIWLGHVYMYAIQLEFDGSPTGTFKLQCSNGRGNNNASKPFMQGEGENEIIVWTDIFGSTQSITEAGDHTWDVDAAAYRWAKVIWTPSGTPNATLTVAKISTKGT